MNDSKKIRNEDEMSQRVKNFTLNIVTRSNIVWKYGPLKSKII